MYSGIDLIDSKNPTSVKANIKPYENWVVLTGDWYHDIVAFAIGIARPLPSGDWEAFEAGILQDGTGMHLYTAKFIRGSSETWYGIPNIGQTYLFELRRVSNLYWEALIDGVVKGSATFSSDVSSEIFSVVQAESGDYSNSLKSSFSNIQWRDSTNWYYWQNINIKEDGGYYTRLFTKHDFDPTILGDSRLDFMVDMLDVSTESSSWTMPPGPAGYLLYADINHNGAVEIDDVSIVSAHWDETWL